MDEALRTILIAAIPGVLSLIVVVIQRRKDLAVTKKEESNAADTITESAIKLVEPLKKQIETLESQVQELEARVAKQDEVIHKLSVGCKKLTRQLLEHNITPIWTSDLLEEHS